MRFLFLIFTSMFMLNGCVDYTMERVEPIDSGINIDVFPVTKSVRIKIEENKSIEAYEKVTSYISSHHDLIFNNEVTLSFSTSAGEKLQVKVADYLKIQGMNLKNLHLIDNADESLQRFDFMLEVLDYKVQVPLCNKPPKYYEYTSTGCIVESNLWSSKVNPEKSLSDTK